MIRLGLRLALLGGAWSIVPTILAGIAVGFGTAILLFALSFQPALDTRLDRGAWRETLLLHSRKKLRARRTKLLAARDADEIAEASRD